MFDRADAANLAERGPTTSARARTFEPTRTANSDCGEPDSVAAGTGRAAEPPSGKLAQEYRGVAGQAIRGDGSREKSGSSTNGGAGSPRTQGIGLRITAEQIDAGTFESSRTTGT